MIPSERTMQNLKRKRIKNGFFQQVYQVVKKIPKGKVTTYGQIARILRTRDARRVGYALHANKDPKVPCHRVVNKDGNLAENFGFDGWREQKRRLEKEGVEVVGRRVELRKYKFLSLLKVGPMCYRTSPQNSIK